MATRITEISSPALWQRLYNAWVAEGQPVRLAVGNSDYKVIQNVEGEMEFEQETPEDLFTSTSFS